MTNLAIQGVNWSFSTTNYYMLLYLMNSFDYVYICSTASSCSEMVAYVVTGYLMDFLGPKKTYIGSFAMSFVGGLLLLIFGLRNQESWTFVFLIILAKFGIVVTQGLNYAAHPEIFPTLFSTTSIGYLIIISYVCSSISDFLARIPQPFPLILFTAFSGVGSVLAFFLQIKTKYPEQNGQKTVEQMEQDKLLNSQVVPSNRGTMKIDMAEGEDQH